MYIMRIQYRVYVPRVQKSTQLISAVLCTLQIISPLSSTPTFRVSQHHVQSQSLKHLEHDHPLKAVEFEILKSQTYNKMSTLARLPTELLHAVIAFLPNRDIKNLRLTCTTLSQIAHLRVKRVFLSANLLNIKVFRAIADHDSFRRRVVEIIWDDTLLVSEIELNDNRRNTLSMFAGMPCVEGVPEWFQRICAWNLEWRGEDRLSVETSWSYYHQLLQEQEDVLHSGADLETLRYGLERFPALRRITITPAAHGLLDSPLYKTPMIRALPPGFNYCVLPAWPLQYNPLDEEDLFDAPPWDQEQAKKWRGFSLIPRELAKVSGHHISEFIVDAYVLNTGLNCRVFDQPNEELNYLVTLLRQPGFSHLDLALIADRQYNSEQGWSSIRSGYLKRALGEASDLRHVSLRFTISYDQLTDWGSLESVQYAEHFIPLRTIFPIDTWKNLQHFGLSGFLVRVDDLLSVLAALPNTLRSVELSFLYFTGENGDYYHLLEAMHDTLDWRDRAVDERPVATIHVPETVEHRYLCMDAVVSKFLYGQGPNPFHRQPIFVGVQRIGFHYQNNAPMETLE
jgi:F-box domain